MISDLLDFLVVANPHDSSGEPLDDIDQSRTEGWCSIYTPEDLSASVVSILSTPVSIYPIITLEDIPVPVAFMPSTLTRIYAIYYGGKKNFREKMTKLLNVFRG